MWKKGRRRIRRNGEGSEEKEKHGGMKIRKGEGEEREKGEREGWKN